MLFFVSCKLTDNCERTEVASISKVSCPKVINYGESAAITLEFGIGNGCGSFKEIRSVQTGNYIYLEVINAFKGCVCTEQYQSGSEVYGFTPSQKGTYYIQYLLSGNSKTTDTLLVK